MAKKQADLPEMEGPGVAPISIGPVEEAAENYIKERDKRMKLTPKEVEAKRKLIATIHEHEDKIGKQPDGTIVYRYEDIIIRLEPGPEKLKVKAARDTGDPEE